MNSGAFATRDRASVCTKRMDRGLCGTLEEVIMIESARVHAEAK